MKLHSKILHGSSSSLRVFLVALVYSVVLAGLPLDVFKDRANYLVYANDSHLILARYWHQGFLAFLSNEPLWLLTNVALRSVMSGEWVLRTLIFGPAFAVAFLVLRQAPKQFIWLMMFLVMAQVMKNHIIHLRQGYAIALFLAGWFSIKREIRWPLMIAPAFVHTSFVFILILVLFLEVARLAKFDPYLQVAGATALGGITGAILPYLVIFSGARQAIEYDFDAADVTGLGFAFWLSVFILFLSAGKSYVRDNVLTTSVVGFYLATYFQIEVTARIFESALLLVLLSALNLSSLSRNVFLGVMVFYFCFQYLQRFGQPYLGWAI